jgi:O-antigen ligase
MAQEATLEAPPHGGKRELMDAWCGRAILALAVFVLVWGPLALGSTRPIEFLVIQSLTAAGLALWGVRMWTQRPFRLLWPPTCWAVLAFLLYALVRCPLVEVEYVGRDQLTHVLVYAAWFIILLNNLNRRESATIVSMTLIAVGSALSFLAVYQFATHATKIWGFPRPEQYLLRASGTFVNPNNLAGFLTMTVPLALSYMVMGRFSATIKVLLGYCALAMMVGILVTVSRGGIIAAGIGLVLLCLVLVLRREYWLPAVVVGCFLLSLGFGLTSEFDTLQRRFDSTFHNDKVNDDRIFYWEGARQLFERQMLWGIGPGHFDVEFEQVRPRAVQVRPQYVHNDYLNTLCEWGMAGAAIVAAACALVYFGAFQTLRAVRKDREERASKASTRSAFVIGASIGLFGVMLHCLVEFNMQIPANAMTAVTLMAILTAQWRFVTERFWLNPGVIGKILLTALALGGSGYLAKAAIHRGTEALWVWRAGTERRSWDQVVADLKNAHQTDPTNPETDMALGENYRFMSLDGNRGYEEKAKEAIQWFRAAMRLNHYDAIAPLRVGMCLDWLGKTQEAGPYFDLATARDPNNSYIAAEVGRHFAAMHDYAAAKKWYQHSMDMAWTYYAYSEMQLLDLLMADPVQNPPK